ncbi:MAG: hypothetical protein AAGU27_07895 [Dehalobacterium sp.]
MKFGLPDVEKVKPLLCSIDGVFRTVDKASQPVKSIWSFLSTGWTNLITRTNVKH